MSASLKVVRIAAVCWASTRRWAIRWRSPLMRWRVSRGPADRAMAGAAGADGRRGAGGRRGRRAARSGRGRRGRWRFEVGQDVSLGDPAAGPGARRRGRRRRPCSATSRRTAGESGRSRRSVGGGRGRRGRRLRRSAASLAGAVRAGRGRLPAQARGRRARPGRSCRPSRRSATVSPSATPIFSTPEPRRRHDAASPCRSRARSSGSPALTERAVGLEPARQDPFRDRFAHAGHGDRNGGHGSPW